MSPSHHDDLKYANGHNLLVRGDGRLYYSSSNTTNYTSIASGGKWVTLKINNNVDTNKILYYISDQLVLEETKKDTSTLSNYIFIGIQSSTTYMYDL